MPAKPIPTLRPPSSAERRYDAMNPWYDPNTEILGKASTVLDLLPELVRPTGNVEDINPMNKAASWGLRPRMLKQLRELVLESIPGSFRNRKIERFLQDEASKYRSVGLLGEKSIAPVREGMPWKGMYHPLSPVLNEEPKLVETIRSSNDPEKVARLLSYARSEYANPYGIELAASNIPTSEVAKNFEHEMRHLGQDVAPLGLLRTSDLDELNSLPYLVRPQEIAARAGVTDKMMLGTHGPRIKAIGTAQKWANELNALEQTRSSPEINTALEWLNKALARGGGTKGITKQGNYIRPFIVEPFK